MRTPSVSNPHTTSAISFVRSGTRSGKNCGRFGICRSPFPGRFGLGRTRKSSFLRRGFKQILRNRAVIDASSRFLIGWERHLPRVNLKTLLNWPDWAITHLAQRLLSICKNHENFLKFWKYRNSGFDKFPCIVSLLSDNKAFFLWVFFSYSLCRIFSRSFSWPPFFLFLCVALGKSIEICHIHFESDQPNYNPKSEDSALRNHAVGVVGFRSFSFFWQFETRGNNSSYTILSI